MKSVSIFSGHALDNAYSCLLYLKKKLETDFNVLLWSDSFGQGEQFGANCKSFRGMWYSKIPKIRFILKWIHVFFLFLFGNNTIIINDLDFFIPAYYAKKLRKSLKVIHYNTEIHGKDVKYFDFIEAFYEKHADFPDMIIECLLERAQYRKQKFGITKNIYVINNTCSRQFIKSVLTQDKGTNYVSDELIAGRKVVVYAGSCEYGIDLDKVVDAVAKFPKDLFFLCFCYGKRESVINLTQKCADSLNVDQFRIYEAIGRDELLNVLYHYGDIGIVYYDPKKSINYLYAAPSKFFEYMAVGLNILSTNNEGINRVINTHHLGQCFSSEKDIDVVISNMLGESTLNKKEIVQLFNTQYCYEEDSKTCIDAIRNIISSDE